MNSDEDWVPCEPGTVQNAVDRQLRAERSSLIVVEPYSSDQAQQSQPPLWRSLACFDLRH